MTDTFSSQPMATISETINPDAYLTFVETLAGQRIKTRGGRSYFTVTVANGRMKFTPESTGKQRDTNFRRVLENFNEIKTFTLKDYRGVTVNASYHLPLIAMYLHRDTV